MKKMIINADDFGLTITCTNAIYNAFVDGLVTDTTIVANGEAYAEAIEMIRDNESLSRSVGIHLNLTEGKPLTNDMINNSKFVTNGTFNGFFINNSMVYVKLSQKDRKDIYNELDAQIKILRLNDICITHADSHQHVHTILYLWPIFYKVLKENEIKRLRIRKTEKKNIFKRFFNVIIRQILRILGFITTDYFGNVKEYSKLREGVSEAMVHPDYNANNVLVDRTMYDANHVAIGNDLRNVILKSIGDKYSKYSYIELE